MVLSCVKWEPDDWLLYNKPWPCRPCLRHISRDQRRVLKELRAKQWSWRLPLWWRTAGVARGGWGSQNWYIRYKIVEGSRPYLGLHLFLISFHILTRKVHVIVWPFFLRLLSLPALCRPLFTQPSWALQCAVWSCRVTYRNDFGSDMFQQCHRSQISF